MTGDQHLKLRVFYGVFLSIIFLVACIDQPATVAPPALETNRPASPATLSPSPIRPSATAAETDIEPTSRPLAETATPMPEVVGPTGTMHGPEQIILEESPPAPLLANIAFFEASPSPIHQGESTELRWEASGVAAAICPITRYTYFTDEDCQPVPATGSLEFTMPDDLLPSFEPGFRLTVSGDDGTADQQAYVYVNLYCPINWFFEPEEASGPLCPEESLSSWTAIQHFENGTMTWMESLERYFIFHGKSISQAPSDLHEQFIQINDPLTIIGDTSGDFTAPGGLYAPESGFGLVWRGDVAESPALVESLGWGTAPEIGYHATMQCAHSGSTQLGSVCYLQGSNGELIWMDTQYQRWLRLR